MSTQKILDKVKKILALATDNPSEGESQAAMLAAQKIMAEHGLTIKDVQIQDVSPKEVVDDRITPLTRTPWWHKTLAVVIAPNFRCEPYLDRAAVRNKTYLRLIGLKEDVDLAAQVFSYALSMIQHYAKEYPYGGERNDYIRGFIFGLKDKFKEQVERNNWGLILVKDNAVINAAHAKGLRKSQASTHTTAGDQAAFASGYRQGKSFETRAGAIGGAE